MSEGTGTTVHDEQSGRVWLLRLGTVEPVPEVCFYDGNRESLAMARKIKTPGQIADIIERFLSGSGVYPQEFNDFFDCSLPDPTLDAYRQRCEVLHGEFEPRRSELILLSLDDRQQQMQREAAATKELEQIVAELRLLERRHNPQARGEPI